MSEPVAVPVTGGPRTPGTLLREARQAQGVHIAALAASMKVSQRKLEALEADRLDELPDATFTRALAQTVCRSLKIDPAPILALLPQHSPGHRLEHVSEGINEPFRDRPGRREPLDLSVMRSPFAWIVYILLIASAVIYLMPQRWLSQWQIERNAGPSASALGAGASSSDLATAPGVVTEVITPAGGSASSAAEAAPVVDGAASASVATTAAAMTAAGPASAASVSVPGGSAFPALLVRARADSWVEVIDSRSRQLLGRTVQPGESVALDGEPPFRVKVGNAAVTELVFQGQPVDLTRSTRDNIARLELK